MTVEITAGSPEAAWQLIQLGAIVRDKHGYRAARGRGLYAKDVILLTSGTNLSRESWVACAGSWAPFDVVGLSKGVDADAIAARKHFAGRRL